MHVASPEATWQLQASACMLVVSKAIRDAVLLVQRQNEIREPFIGAICCSLARIGYNIYCLGFCALSWAANKPARPYVLLVFESTAEHCSLLIVTYFSHSFVYAKRPVSGSKP